jgi:uncharacterized protein YndB with AHSA1/START domain
MRPTRWTRQSRNRMSWRRSSRRAACPLTPWRRRRVNWPSRRSASSPLRVWSYTRPSAIRPNRRGGGARRASPPQAWSSKLGWETATRLRCSRGGQPLLLDRESREVDPPASLVVTFVWEDPDPNDLETVVALSFRALGEWTEVALTQGPFKTDSRRALHRNGWTDSLDKLARLLLART